MYSYGETSLWDGTEWSFKCTRSSLSEAKTPVCESGELGRHQL